ncbi:MAG: hypothetical protein M5U26_00630 [Planctomycetota bacterium]|nr:hypothetical protein [Planctomycetota bacterium]
MHIMTTGSSILTSTQTVHLTKSQRAALFARKQRQKLIGRIGGVLLLGLAVLIAWAVGPEPDRLARGDVLALEVLPPVFAMAFFGLYGLWLLIRARISNAALVVALAVSALIAGATFGYAQGQARKPQEPAAPLLPRAPAP